MLMIFFLSYRESRKSITEHDLPKYSYEISNMLCISFHIVKMPNILFSFLYHHDHHYYCHHHHFVFLTLILFSLCSLLLLSFSSYISSPSSPFLSSFLYHLRSFIHLHHYLLSSVLLHHSHYHLIFHLHYHYYFLSQHHHRIFLLFHSLSFVFSYDHGLSLLKESMCNRHTLACTHRHFHI